jgi:hypothetical protein
MAGARGEASLDGELVMVTSYYNLLRKTGVASYLVVGASDKSL